MKHPQPRPNQKPILLIAKQDFSHVLEMEDSNAFWLVLNRPIGLEERLHGLKKNKRQ